MILTMTVGGAERQLAHLASQLGARGHDVHVAYVFPGPNAERLAGHCTLHHLSASRRWPPLVVAQSFELLRRLRPDVVHTWLTHMDIVAGTASRIMRVPWVMSERSAALYYPRTPLNRMRVAVGKRAAVIVPNSSGGAEYWLAQGVDSARIEIVPNFVPVVEIEAALPLVDSRLADDDELIVHVGRLSAEKNLRRLVDSLQHVFSARPRARFAFCGDGPLREELRAQVHAAGLAERVIFAGFVPDVAPWLKRARVAVAVSLLEGHPNAALEAVAAGVPIVVSDIPAYRSILQDGSALFVAENDAEAIGTAVVNSLADRAAAERRAACARSTLARQSLDATAARYEEVYLRLIASGRDRSSSNGALK
jgi:GalNAc-alpha-(1->4)-GalNAc-alpha-(1->3)-diNAcBac-PP-undecaprenol alpha-1,4-N-acetyl-D-galactosaminyltransferase